MLFAAPEGVATKVRVVNPRLLLWSRISTCSPGGGISRRILSTRPEHALPLALSDVFGEAAKVIIAGNGGLICGDEVPVVLIFRQFGVDEEIGRDARGKVVIAEFGAKGCDAKEKKKK